MRHGALDLPYPSYDEMPFAYLCALASGMIDPSIDEAFVRVALEKVFSDVVLTEPIRIFSSPARRCMDTSRILCDFLSEKLQRDFFVDAYLPEVSEARFDLKKLYIPEDGRVNMSAVNAAVFEGFLAGECAESVTELCQRAERVLAQFSRGVGTAICVTHDFFMRFLELVIRQGGQCPQDISASILASTWRNGHCAGFMCEKDYKQLRRLRL